MLKDQQGALPIYPLIGHPSTSQYE